MTDNEHDRGGQALSAGTSSGVLQKERFVVKRNRKCLATGVMGAVALAMGASAANADFVLVDDFEGYAADASAVGSNGWIGSSNTGVSYLRAVADPKDPTNQVGRTAPAANNRVANSEGAVEAGKVATLFFRLYLDPAKTTLVTGIGFTNMATTGPTVASPSGDQWGPLMRLNGTALQVHDGPTNHADYYQTVTSPDDLSPMPTGDWYSFWMVANTSDQTWSLYVQGGDIEEQTRVAHGTNDQEFAFRGGSNVTEFVNFAIVPFTGHGTEHYIYLDDVHIDVDSPVGGNLNNPIPEPGSLALAAVGGLFVLNRRSRD